MYRLTLLLAIGLFLLSLHSCVPSNKLYFFNDLKPSTQQIDSATQSSRQRIHKGDRISITVSCPDPTQTSFLNTLNNQNTGSASQQLNGYLVDPEGKISFPLLGDVYIDGLTSEELAAIIKKKLEFYFKDPYVAVNLSGRIYFINGRNGTTIPMLNERLTILEAIAQSGTQDAFDKKNEVWIVREENGKRDFAQVNLNSKEIFQSSYFYLHNNDVIYMKPGRYSSFLSTSSPGRTVLTVTAAALTLYFAIKKL